MTKEERREYDRRRYWANPEAQRARRRKYYAQNSEKEKAYAKVYSKENSEKIKEYSIEHSEQRKATSVSWREANKEYCANYRKKWNTENKPLKAALEGKRRATKLGQTPEDADLDKIAELYTKAKTLELKTGVKYHVDHIIPLSKGGLHHQDNLQILTAEENLKKHAKF